MGGTTSIQQTQEFNQRLQFIQITEDQNFGKIQIFRSKEPPYEYIMNYNKTFLVKDEKFKNYLELMKKLKQKTHKNLTKLHFVEDKEENQMCIKNFKMSSYFNYYNFTLKKAIEKKKSTGNHFLENQLWYVLICLLEIGKYLKMQNISLGDYTASKVFLTPQGYIKLYLLNIDLQNHHNSYFSVLSQKQNIQNHLLSPEQLQGIQQNIYQIEFDIYKSDVFSIAMIILEMMFLDDPKFYYNIDHYEVNFGRIKYNLASMKGEYSTEFQTILFYCLEQNPKSRVDFQSALAYIDKIRKNLSISGSIKLVDEEQNQMKKKKSNQIKKLEGKHTLKNLPNNIDQRLMVIPITTYSGGRIEFGDQKKRNSNMGLMNMMQTTTSTISSLDRRNKQSHK